MVEHKVDVSSVTTADFQPPSGAPGWPPIMVHHLSHAERIVLENPRTGALAHRAALAAAIFGLPDIQQLLIAAYQARYAMWLGPESCRAIRLDADAALRQLTAELDRWE